MPDQVELHYNPDPSAVIDDLAQWLVERAAEAVYQRGFFRWALSGGSTPRQLYALLASEAWQDKMPWQKTALFFGDERDVPPTHAESNYHMVDQALLQCLHTPPWIVGRWRTELDPAMALCVMQDVLVQSVPLSAEFIPQLDVVLLGLGPEGHTASIFPDSPVLRSTRWIEHVFVPDKNIWRYTFTLSTINQARHCAFLVTGASKAEIVRSVLTGGAPRLPASQVHPTDGQVHWFIDAAAYNGLNPSEARP